MTEFTKYSTITEEILEIGGCALELLNEQCKENEAILEGVFSPDTWYISYGLPYIRQAFDLSISTLSISADGIDSSTITNIPNNTTVRIVNTSYLITTGSLTFTSTEVGDIVLEFTHKTYLTEQVIINAY